MHELSIAEALVKAVREEAAAHYGTRVTAVRVQIGRLRLVEPAALQLCYEATAREQGLAGSRLEIEPVAAQGECRECGERFAVEEPVFLCPRCDSADVTLLAGKELLLTGVELEQA